MCGDKECGIFRVYTTSDHSVTEWWLQDSGSGPHGATPPPQAPLIHPVAGTAGTEGEMQAKFKQGNERHWATPKHFGPDCPEGCHCVQMLERVGDESSPEQRSWRQPMTVTGGVKIVVRGTYKIKFQDFKGKCDVNDEVGEPVSYGGEDQYSLRDAREYPPRKPV